MTHSKPRHFSVFLHFGFSLFLILCTVAFHCSATQGVQAESFNFETEAGLYSIGQQKVIAPDGEAKDGFGYSSVISDDGSTALIGFLPSYASVGMPRGYRWWCCA